MSISAFSESTNRCKVTIMHQHLQSIAAPVGKEIGMLRLRLTEDPNNPRQNCFCVPARMASGRVENQRVSTRIIATRRHNRRRPVPAIRP